jgi:glycosyltransferase involved in cell wall biosynthesis
MKILRVFSSADPKIGGPVEGAFQLTASLNPLGHVTEAVSVDAPDQPWMNDMPFKVHGLGPAKSSYCYSSRLLPWLKENASNYDLVIVHGLWQYHGFAVWQALHGSSTPYMVYSHGMLDPWFKHTYPLKHLKKCLYWPWGEYRILRDAKAVCFTCEEERILARTSFSPYRCSERVVSYGIRQAPGDPDAQREGFLNEFPALRGKNVILFLSRIHVKKGCDLLIEAFAKAYGDDPDTVLVMAGPDKTGYKPELLKIAERFGIADRIVWPGMLKGDMKWGAFRAASAFALPSHQENFGIAVAEALACGLPVLISDKVNIWREIEGAGAGIVGTDDAEGTTKVFARWKSLSDAERTAMSEKALECFLEKFEIKNTVANFLSITADIGVKDLQHV